MKASLILLLTFLAFNTKAQTPTSLISIEPDTTYENIHVQQLDSDSLASTFIIWIKSEVKEHKHIHHSETIYIIEGTATIIVDGKELSVKAGDYIFVPKGTTHAVKVTSNTPLKVLSIQAPYFNGSDREYTFGN